jgi:DNA (cytosine-5)-methyltransferase 1
VSSKPSVKAKPATPLNNTAIRAPDTELQGYKLGKGCVIKPGDTVELKDHSSHAEDTMHSADFLRIKHIILDRQTNKIRLRGYRLRRAKYFGQLFHCKSHIPKLISFADFYQGK